MHTADLQQDKAMGKRVGMTVLVLFVVMIGLIIVANMIS
jgi:tetrahydromethanopterin S-methyltransferase subunit G